MLHFGHMSVLIIAMLASYGLEVYCLYANWKARRILMPIAATIAVFAAAGMAFWLLNAWSAVLLVTAAYRFFHHIVVADGRSQERYIHESAKQRWQYFAAVQITIVIAWWLSQSQSLQETAVIFGATGSALVSLFGLIAVVSVWRWRSSALLPALPEKHRHTKDLPAVTVAIPARNETEVLERCLQAVLASDYPKLEVLVLDDCSQDATADIIKSFAHDGVRFVQGQPTPNSHWVHKNYASHQLLEHASGSLVLSMGVDVLVQPHTISQLVNYMIIKNMSMVAIMPQRQVSGGRAWLQTIRYWWEVALPRDLLRRPAVLSSCYMFNAEAVKKLGGYEAVSRMIVPEAYFARELSRQKAYAFVRSNTVLGVTSLKSNKEQYSTAVRVRYPQVSRRTELVMMATLLWLLCWVMPIVAIYHTGGTLRTALLIVAALGWLNYSASFALVTSLFAPH